MRRGFYLKSQQQRIIMKIGRFVEHKSAAMSVGYESAINNPCICSAQNNSHLSWDKVEKESQSAGLLVVLVELCRMRWHHGAVSGDQRMLSHKGHRGIRKRAERVRATEEYAKGRCVPIVFDNLRLSFCQSRGSLPRDWQNDNRRTWFLVS